MNSTVKYAAHLAKTITAGAIGLTISNSDEPLLRSPARLFIAASASTSIPMVPYWPSAWAITVAAPGIS
ncbi:hypothetical protein D3C79_988390 [compost metagenome]